MNKRPINKMLATVVELKPEVQASHQYKHIMMVLNKDNEDITYADSMGHCFFALPDGSYVYQDGNTQLLCGRAYRIRNGILELLTLDGETLDVAKLNH